MRYFITGTAGFIGFHLARRLLEDGHEVLGFDGMTPYYSLRLKEARNAGLAQFPAFRPVIGMLEDKSLLDKSVEDFKPDVLIHLAAQAGVRYSLENPKAYLDPNLVGSWNILEIARNYGVGHLMLASTSSVYGANPDIPFRETDRADEPLTFYAATKKATELMAHSYAHLYKLPITGFRFFTVYGPWGRPDMALFKFVKAMIEDREIEIYGEGKMSRDFTYIDDLVNSIIDLSKVYPGEDNRVEGIDTPSSGTLPGGQYRRRPALGPHRLRRDDRTDHGKTGQAQDAADAEGRRPENLRQPRSSRGADRPQAGDRSGGGCQGLRAMVSRPSPRDRLSRYSPSLLSPVRTRRRCG